MEDIGKFTSAATRAKFLFGSGVTEFLEARRIDLISEFTERNRPRVEVPPERQKAAEDKYVARLDRLTTNFVKDFDALVDPYMKHTQKRVALPYIDA